MISHNTTPWLTDGSCALEQGRPHLILLEGGPQYAAESERMDARGSAISGRSPALGLFSIALVCALLLGTFLASAWSEQARLESAFSEVQTELIYVMPGDSLWQISEGRVPAGASVRETVSWIKEANGLANAELHVGDRLMVPVAQLE